MLLPDRSSMGTKRHKGRVIATTKTEKNPTAMERSPVQTNKHPRMRKSLRRRQIKSRLCHRRPLNSTSKEKKDQARSQDSDVPKRIPCSQERRLKTNFGGKTECLALFPTEPRVNHIPPKTPDKQELSSTTGMKGEDQSVDSQRIHSVDSKTDKPQPPLKEKVSSIKENKRSKLSTTEKRCYQTVSEYQFIYPGRAVFHCTRESAKQQLRSIYLGPRGQKPLKPTHQDTQMMLHYQLDKKKIPRENIKTDPSCPVGGELLRSMHPSATTSGLTSLTYKINKLALVSETETAAPHSRSLQHLRVPSKLSPTAAVFQGASSSDERKTDREGRPGAQDLSPEFSVRGAAGKMLKESPASSTQPRPLSAKDYFGKAPSMKSIEYKNGDCSKREDMAGSMLDVSTSSKGGVTHTQSATTKPSFHQFSSEENVNVEVPPNACLNTTQREPLPTDFSQPAAREEKRCKTLGHCSLGDRRDAYPLVTAGSKSKDPVRVDTW